MIIQTEGFNHEDGIVPIETLLKSKNIPDAIFAVNDRLAVSAMRTAKKLNFKIPDDISIIGFDDEPHSSYFTPPLSRFGSLFTVWVCCLSEFYFKKSRRKVPNSEMKFLKPSWSLEEPQGKLRPKKTFKIREY
jgi:hypothetical protein